jgi:hypothetical protein
MTLILRIPKIKILPEALPDFRLHRIIAKFIPENAVEKILPISSKLIFHRKFIIPKHRKILAPALSSKLRIFFESIIRVLGQNRASALPKPIRALVRT